MSFKDQALERLPKWAQARIQQLEGSVAYERLRANAITAPVGDKKKGMVTYGSTNMSDERAIPPLEAVYFWIGDGSQDYVEVRHARDFDDEAVSVRAGMTTLLVQPHAGNGIIVEPADLPAFTRRQARRVQYMIDNNLCTSCGAPLAKPSRTGCRGPHGKG